MGFKAKQITRDKETHYMTIKRPVHQEDTEILNVHAYDNRTPKCMKEKLIKLKGEMGLLGDSCALPSSEVN